MADGQLVPKSVDPLHYLSFPKIRVLQEQWNKVIFKLIVDGINGS